MKKGLSDKIISLVSYIFTLVFSIFCMYPLLLTLMVSLSDENRVQLHGYKLIPEKLSFDTFIYLWDKSSNKIINAYTITVIVTVGGTLISMIVTSMLAYAISQKNIKYRNVISLFAYFTVIFSAGIVPWYVVCVNVLHITNSILGLIMPYMVNVWFLFLLRTYFQSIPDAVVESAKIDGANDIYIFIRIIMPLSKTAILTISMFYALQFWNDWWLPIMLLSRNSLFPLQYYLYSILTNVNALSNGGVASAVSSVALPTETVKMAVTIVTIGPIILLYPFVQKYFVKGIMLGAVKG